MHDATGSVWRKVESNRCIVRIALFVAHRCCSIGMIINLNMFIFPCKMSLAQFVEMSSIGQYKMYSVTVPTLICGKPLYIIDWSLMSKRCNCRSVSFSNDTSYRHKEMHEKDAGYSTSF